MASRIKGITIEIDGKTKPLESALKHVNSDLSKTQSSLRDVERLLKLDPGNTDLLAQKQRLLQDAIDGTEKKLSSLKEAQAQAKQQLEAGTLGQEKYDALQREIVATERQLDSFKSKASETSAALKSSSSGLDSFASSADSLSGKLSGVSKAAGGLAAGAAAAVPATQELRRDLSFLYQNARDAGVGIGATEKAFKTFNAVSGETDSSVEAVSNLLQAGFTTSNLQIAVEGLAGAASRFPDTLKIEGLADGLQETLATGKAVGPFGELLDRLGIGADNFSNGLANCTTEAEKQNYALQTMAKAGLMDSYKGWRDNNEALAEYEDSTLEMQMALGDLAEAISPIVTGLAKLATAGLEAFNGLPKPMQAVAGGLVGITAAAGPTISAAGKVAGGISKLKTAAEEGSTAAKALTRAGKGAASALSVIPAPAAAAAAAAVVVGGAIYSAYESTHKYTNAAKEMSEANAESVSSINSQAETAQFYAQQLDMLSQKENKTAQDKQLIQAYVDKLNGSVEGLGLSYDAETDKLNQSTDAVYKKIDAMKQEALQSAYLEHSKKALESYTESQIKMAEAQEKVKTAQEAYDKAAESGYVSQQLSTDLAQAKAEYNDLKSATSTYWTEYLKQSNAAAMASGQWDKLVNEAKSAGIKIPESLTQGIKSGQYAIPTTVEELKALIQFDDMVNRAGVSGTKTAKELSAKLAAGQIDAQTAAQMLSSAIDNGLGAEVPKAGAKGSSTGKSFASGAKGTSGQARSAGTSLGQAAQSGAGSVSLYSTGYNIGAGLAHGMRNALTVVRNAAHALASAADEAIRKKQEVASPSRLQMRNGQYIAEGLAIGMLNRRAMVRTAATELAGAADAGIDAGFTPNVTAQRSLQATTSAKATKFDYNQLAQVVKSAASGITFTIVMDQRELGRGLRGMGVQFA